MNRTRPPIPRRLPALPRSLVAVALALLAVACNKAGHDIQLGDPATAVRARMGAPTAVYRSRAAIEAARFGHYWFTDLRQPGAEPTHADLLPEVEGRALWFRHFGTAGTLVYLDADDRVAAVFFAGT
jgi:hypothetical protein